MYYSNPRVTSERRYSIEDEKTMEMTRSVGYQNAPVN